jgi:hypothetical protein
MLTTSRRYFAILAFGLTAQAAATDYVYISFPKRTCSENIDYCTTEAEKQEFYRAEAERRAAAQRAAAEAAAQAARERAKKEEWDRNVAQAMKENNVYQQRKKEFERLMEMEEAASIARWKQPLPPAPRCNPCGATRQ